MAKPKPRVKVPKKAAKGDVIEIKTLISHKMESGQRKDKKGNLIPRDIINKFTAKYNGETVFWADWAPAISANPFMGFHVKIEEAGEFEFVWEDDKGESYSTKKKLSVA